MSRADAATQAIPLRIAPRLEGPRGPPRRVGDLHLRDLFADDPAARRAPGRSRRPGSTSTTPRTGSPTRRCSCSSQLAEECGLARAHRRDVPRRADQRHRGPRRAARRAARAARPLDRGRRRQTSSPDVHEVLDRMAAFAERVRGGDWTGHTGKRIRNVVNIGIGGSDLGPVMAYEALRHYSRRDLTFRFVSNVDGTDFAEATRDLDPAETLFIVSLEDVHHARDDDQRPHARATGRSRRSAATRRRSPSTSSPSRPTPRRWRSSASTPSNMFGFWDWVGGRYSMDSAIGLSTMLAIGPDGFREHARRLPRDGRALPHARRSSATCRCCWACSASGTATSSAPRPSPCCPYEQYLKRFPAYLQQLTMESNGKHVTLDGRARSTTRPAPIFWGEPGTNGQHSFYQLIHQGTQADPVRLHRLLPDAEPARRPPRPADGERVRADRGAGVRQDRRGGRAPRARRRSWCRTASSRATGRRTRSWPSG